MEGKINQIDIYCSGTRGEDALSLSVLKDFWRESGSRDVGYHFYIARNGFIFCTCPVQTAVEHIQGMETYSIGICYEGGLDARGYPADTRTEWQIHSMQVLVLVLLKDFPGAKVIGHCDLEPWPGGGGSIVERWKQAGEHPCFEVADGLRGDPDK